MNKTFNEMKINIGPQHPSTHGVLRLVLKLDGETIKSCEPVVGYLHRGMEKMAENRSYLQYLPTVDRIDYLSGFFNSFAYCDAIENLLGLDIPIKAKYIRVLCMELNRLASHLLWLGTFMLDLGATSPLFYCFRDRERILTIFEKLTGQRLMYNYFTFGGVRHDIEDDLLNEILDFTKDMPANICDYENIITENPIFKVRTVNKGILTKKIALQYAVSGVNLRASGINLDFRKQKPYLIYDKLDFTTSFSTVGDSYSRYEARIFEMKTCLDLIEQCVDMIKTLDTEINISSLKPTLINIESGEHTSIVEAPRGLTMCTVIADGKKPYRVKWRTGSYYAVEVLPQLVIDSEYPDLMAIFGSLDIILPEVDK